MQREPHRIGCRAVLKALLQRPDAVVCLILSAGFFASLYGYGFVSCRPGGNMWELISSYEGGGMIAMSGSWLALPLRMMEEPYKDLSNSTCGGTYNGKRPAPSLDTFVCFPAMDVRAEEMYVVFKSGFTSLLGLSGSFVVMSRIAEAACGVKGRIWNSVIFSMILILFAHGLLGGFILLTMAVASSLLSGMARRWTLATAQLSIWIFCLGCMEAIFRLLGDHPHAVQDWPKDQGFKFWSQLEDIVCGKEVLSQPFENDQLCWLSTPFLLKGAAPWFIFRFAGLRFVSFALDSLWCFHKLPSAVRDLSSQPELIQRTETHLDPEKYCIINYLAYLGYVPLFASGPVLSYNAFVSQMEAPQKTYTRKDILGYGSQLLLLMFCFEVFSVVWWYSYKLNQITCDSASSYSRCIFDDLSVWELYLGMHVRLVFSWISLMIVWRFSRFMALLDDIDSPENMLDCVFFRYTFEAFWRIWHASMNRFMLRYLYSPLGGKRRPLLAVLVVFAFVAYWHENTGFWTQRIWYAWGFLNGVGVMLEKKIIGTVGKSLANKARSGNLLAESLIFLGRGVGPIILIFANVLPLYAENSLHFYRNFFFRGWESFYLLSTLVLVYGCIGYVVDTVREIAVPSKQQPLKQGSLESNESHTELPTSHVQVED